MWLALMRQDRNMSSIYLNDSVKSNISFILDLGCNRSQLSASWLEIFGLQWLRM